MPKSKKSVSVRTKSRKVILKKAREAKLANIASKILGQLEEDRPHCNEGINFEGGNLIDDMGSNYEQFSEISSNEIDTEPDVANNRDSSILHGRRIVDIQSFLMSLKAPQHDGFGCSFFDMEVKSEKIEGLESVITSKCKMCHKIDSVKTGHGNCSFDSPNRAGVIGALSIGIGYTQFSELLAALDIPQLSNVTYLKYHNSITTSVHDLNEKLMTNAAENEAELAEERNCEGVPIVGVIADGAWGKRSYRRNYSALSGVASIIGAKTKKILYMGVKNKYCFVCVRGRDKQDHKCFKNWAKTKRKKCYFIVYTTTGIHVEEIERDDSFWSHKMIIKLEQFYMKSLLPELVDTRRSRGLDIRTVYMSN